MVVMFVLGIVLFVFAVLGLGHIHVDTMDGHRGNKQKVFHGTSDGSWNLFKGPVHLTLGSTSQIFDQAYDY